MIRKLSFSKRISLGAMTAALNLLALYAAAVLPTGRAACLFLSGVFVYALACERAYPAAILCFLATAGLSFAILPQPMVIFAYIGLVGHYGIFHTFIGQKVRGRLRGMLLVLLYADAWLALSLWLAGKLLAESPIAQLLALWPAAPWLLIPLSQAALLAVDVLYRIVQTFYQARLRFAIVGRK